MASRCYMLTAVALVFSGRFQKWESRANNVTGQLSGSDAVCSTPECVSTAAAMKSKMNLSADPCQDFNEYACGRYVAETDIPDGMSSISPLLALKAENTRFVGDILNTTGPNDAPYMSLIRLYFRSCLNEDQIENFGLRSFFNERVVTAWPTLNPNWNETNFNLAFTIMHYFNVFVAPLFDTYMFKDLGGCTIGLYITPPNLKLDSTIMKKGKSDPQVLAYLNYLIEFAVALNVSRAVAERDANMVVDLEIDLSQIMSEPTGNLRELYNPIQLKQADKLYPALKIPWVLRTHYRREIIGIPLGDYDRIIIMYPAYMKNIESVLECHSKRAIENLFGFHYALLRLEGLTRRMRQLKLQFDQSTMGVETETPTWERCVESTSDNFDLGISKQFVTRKFSETGKQKLAAMQQKIGFPDTDFDDAYVTRLYENLNISNDYFYYNRFDAGLKTKLQELALYGQPTNKSKWPASPYDAEAFYVPNEMVFTAGLLQPPFFSASYPDYISYGSIGRFIGHELTHGFDSRGRGTDGEGLLSDWWTEEDTQQFNNRTKCIADHFSQFHIDEINRTIDGESVQEESEAELGGLKSSLRAYKKRVLRHGLQPRLPGLNLTQDQLYFVAYAQTICHKFTTQGLINHLENNDSPPGKYRINGILQHSEDFATAYSCSPGSYMNPERKCSVW